MSKELLPSTPDRINQKFVLDGIVYNTEGTTNSIGCVECEFNSPVRCIATGGVYDICCKLNCQTGETDFNMILIE